MNAHSFLRSIGLLSAALLVAGCSGQAVSPTDQMLIRQADQLHARLAPRMVEDQDPRMKRYFEQLAGRVVSAARELDQKGTIQTQDEGSRQWMFSKDIDFHLVNSELPTLYTSGAEHIYVYDGLFQQCKNEDELASLLCHGYAHVYARHAQMQLKPEPSPGGDEALLRPFVMLKFTPAQERAADQIALTVYLKAGWDPTRFAELYARLAQEDSGSLDSVMLHEKAQPPQSVPAAARDWAQPPVADDARFAQLQAETKAVVANAPPNPRATLLLSAFSGCFNVAEGPVQARARLELFPPSQGPTEDKWNKGLQGAR